MPAQYVKAYIKRNKHDAADAEAICEAVGRPTMRFVPVKAAEQQATQLLHRGREQLVRQRTMLVNALRAHLAEFGLVAAQGLRNVGELIAPRVGAKCLQPTGRALGFATGLAFGAQLKAESTRDLLGRPKQWVDPFFGLLFRDTDGRPHTLERPNTANPRMPSTNTEGSDEISCPSPLVVNVPPLLGHTTCQWFPVLSSPIKVHSLS